MFEYAMEVLNYKLFSHKEKIDRLDLSCSPEYMHLCSEDYDDSLKKAKELSAAIKILQDADKIKEKELQNKNKSTSGCESIRCRYYDGKICLYPYDYCLYNQPMEGNL